MTSLLLRLTALLLISLCTLAAAAQDADETPRDKAIRELLGMSKPQYKDYSKTIKDFDKRLRDVLKDSTLTPAVRSSGIKTVLSEKRTYQQQALSEEQRKKLTAFNRQGAPESPHQKQQKKVEERLRKKGITVTTDTSN